PEGLDRSAGTLSGRRIGLAPVGLHEIAEEHRARLIRGVVADGDHDIQRRRTFPHKAIPGLAAETFGGNTKNLELFDRIGIDAASRLTAGAEGFETAF